MAHALNIRKIVIYTYVFFIICMMNKNGTRFKAKSCNRTLDEACEIQKLRFRNQHFRMDLTLYSVGSYKSNFTGNANKEMA